MQKYFLYNWVLKLAFLCYLTLAIGTSHVYIAYLGHNHGQNPRLILKSHVKLLSDVFFSVENARKSLLHSYSRSFSGFAASLNSSQADILAKMDGVISVFKSRSLRLHTTRSWDFMGLNLHKNKELTSMQLTFGNDIVVGVFDTGIWPEAQSFKDDSMLGPAPSRWRGKCVAGEQFDPASTCNKKLIGARFYVKGFEQEFGPLNSTLKSEYRSARDFLGHGTHTASTSVGSVVKNASFFGFGQGIARGGAPLARLAVYKVCWSLNLDGICTEADILKAFDDALNDGVHVISASFGGSPPLAPFFASSAGIGSFHAMQMGVSVVFSAGNDGPDPSLVQNVAPWSICIAASSIDRAFPAKISLDNKLFITGQGLIKKKFTGKLAGASAYFGGGICSSGNWNRRLASGKIILCFSTIGPLPSSDIAVDAAWRANATALIYVDPLYTQAQEPGVDILPTVRLDFYQGTKLDHYLGESLKLPVVKILPTVTVNGKTPAPAVAHFSSRGPSSISPDILKPDLAAPGLGILAAWPTNVPPSFLPGDARSVNWNFQSGTSQSCPHVTGIVALIKSAHPSWSPAAIRSALMTTADNEDSTGDRILSGGSMKMSDPFDIGAGHINPIKAMNPGLVYDMNIKDYITYLCTIGYTENQISAIVTADSGTSFKCPKPVQSISNLNYPSITVSNLRQLTTIKRALRNVGSQRSVIYFVSLMSPDGVEVTIWPRVLVFGCWVDEVSYYVTVKPVKVSKGRYDFGHIVWSYGAHRVRSPLVVAVNNAD